MIKITKRIFNGINRRIPNIFKTYFKKSDYNLSKRVSFSQTGEDMIVDFIFNAKNIYKPTYIDIGAFHPFHYSNTAYFYKKKSRGINIEPNPDGFKKFQKERSRDINLNMGVSNIEGKLDYFFLNAATMNTFDADVAQELVEKYGFKLVKKKEALCTTLQHVLSKYANNIFPDFLSLDVEGLDMEILNQIDYEQNYPKVICVETVGYTHDGTGSKDIQLINFLESKGYFIFADTSINTIFSPCRVPIIRISLSALKIFFKASTKVKILAAGAFCVISDSGTIAEEGSLLNLPAITIRQAHERPEGMDEGTLIMSGLKKERVIEAIEIVTKQHRKDRAMKIVKDYDVDNVSKKVLRIILSYTDYINRTVWHK